MSEKKTITGSEYLALAGIVAYAASEIALIERLERKACDILGIAKTGGHTSDMLFGDRKLDDLLGILNIEVQD